MSRNPYNRQEALELVEKYGEDVKAEITLVDEQLSAFHRQALRDFVVWLYESEDLTIVGGCE